MGQTVIAKSAYRELDLIWEFIACNNPEAARRVVDEIIEQATSLGNTPNVGTARPELGKGIRSFAVVFT